ncbi:hypothetical protein LTR42_006169 [Elasticomyces elasticus]|nr:hypothetical protein LTR42_006169 [Elasticomyces elasticus]
MSLELEYRKEFPPPTAERTDKTWPIGYPVRAEKDLMHGTFLFRKGQIGVVLELHKERGAVRVQLADVGGQAGDDGYVPLAGVYIGQWGKMGNWWVWIDVDRLRAAQRGSTPSMGLQTNTLRTTIHMWLKAIHDNYHRFAFSTAWLEAVLHNEDAIGDMADRLYDGFGRAGMLDIISTNHYVAQDIMNCARPLTGAHGNYLIVGLEGQLGGQGIIYSGKTSALVTANEPIGGFYARNQGHIGGIALAKTETYKKMAKARYLKMIPVCILYSPVEIALGEQFITSFVGTYDDDVLNPLAKLSDLTETDGEKGNHRAEHKANALIMQDIARTVAHATGYSIATERLAFGAAGLNIKSPITESAFEQATFVKTSAPLSNTYRRSNMAKSSGAGQMAYQFSNTAGVFNLTMSVTLPEAHRRNPNIYKEGTHFDFVFDVRKNKQPHPKRMYNLPEVGSSPDHELALSLSAGFEIVGPDGHRYRMHYYANDDIDPQEACARAVAIVRYLQREKVAKPSDDDVKYYDFGRAKLLEISVSEIAQCYKVTQSTPSTLANAPKKLKSKDDVWNELHARGAESRASQNHWPRESCDATIINYAQCVRIKADSCTFCDPHGRPCTFTKNIEDAAVQAAKPALVAALKSRPNVREVLDLGIASRVQFR